MCVRVVSTTVRLQTAPKVLLSPPRRRLFIPPAVRAAAGAGLAAGACVLLLLSPSLAVRQVSWTGAAQPPAARRQALEARVVGRPLMLLSQRRLEHLLEVDSSKLSLRFERHLPGTLEVIVVPRFAVWLLAPDQVLDARGRLLDPSHAVPGLKRLTGFALDPERNALQRDDQPLLARLLQTERQTGLEWDAVLRQGNDLVLTLRPSQQQVWLASNRLDSGLRKLCMLARRMEAAELPGRVDLRYRDQIVLAAHGREARDARP